MIARMWRGRTPGSKADSYLEYLRGTGLKEYAATQGNQGVLVLRRVGEGEAEFILISLWDSDEAIRRFAGEDPERAVYYPETNTSSSGSRTSSTTTSWRPPSENQVACTSDRIRT